MATKDNAKEESNPLENPLVRHGIGLSGAVVITVVAFFFLEGTLMWIALGIAVLDAVVTPRVLERAVKQEE